MPEEKPSEDPAASEPPLSELGRALFGEDTGPLPLPAHTWMPPAQEELQGMLPQYDILDMIGRGGMGAVYLASQSTLDRLVAIKILSTELDARDPGFSQRFKNEARAMAKLSHSGIVAIHDFGETATGLHYIVMEYIEGTNVQQMIAASRRLHTEHALAIAAHVCDALHYAHERGIIHRDIKPANIIVGYDGAVKVADFGLAKISAANEVHQLTRSGTTLGTPHYIAPEALVPGTPADRRADIYATGVMLYHMLTGKLPQGLFELPSIQVPGLDPRLDAIIARAMREDRDLRYPTAADMRADLDGILTQPIPPSGPEAALPLEVRPKRPGKRPPGQNLPTVVKRNASFWRRPVTLVLALGTLGTAIFHHLTRPSAHSGRFVHTVANDTSVSLPTAATKEQPFTNSLGMKFVPVPGTGVLFSIYETRWMDYAAFAAETPALDALWTDQSFKGIQVTGPAGEHPVIQVSWLEAVQFCNWLTLREREQGRIHSTDVYRLPTDQEWSHAVGIGDQESPGLTPAEKSQAAKAYPWAGGSYPPGPQSGNFGDLTAKRLLAGKRSFAIYFEDFDDGYPTTAPVGRFQPNALGIYDLAGNVMEWCEDWYDLLKLHRVQRGSGWMHGDVPHLILSSYRYRHQPEFRSPTIGFRVVLEVSGVKETKPSDASLALSDPVRSLAPLEPLPPATKEQPFINSLGMKFVPVPGTDTLFCIHETRCRDYIGYAAVNPAAVETWPQEAVARLAAEDLAEHPMTHVNGFDARAFCTWLSQKENRLYRLPTDREWSLAVGIGELEDWGPSTTPTTVTRVTDAYPWGTGWPPPPGAGNYSDQSRVEAAPPDMQGAVPGGYNDGFPGTAPVMSFPPNKLGLYDMGGNVWEIVHDWSNHSKESHVMRGASFISYATGSLLASMRASVRPESRMTEKGFRLVLASSEPVPPVPPPQAAATGSPSSTAAQDGAPPFFKNSLDMVFLPVPGTKVLFSIYETRWMDYAAFAAETPGLDPSWKEQSFRGIALEDFAQFHPVIGVSWLEADQFCQWLTAKERAHAGIGPGDLYRLPTDAEWSHAAGIGDLEQEELLPVEKNQKVEAYPWPGGRYPPGPGDGNFADRSAMKAASSGHNALKYFQHFDDGYPTTAPVGRFKPNALGLFDLAGNVMEWCQDGYDKNQRHRVIRGTAWMQGESSVHTMSSFRSRNLPTFRTPYLGFRVVLARAED